MVHRLGFGGRAPPDLPPQIAALKENSLLPDAGSRISSAKSSRILFLIANIIMLIYGRSRSDKYCILVIICVQRRGPSCSLPMGREAEVADCRARWRLLSGLKCPHQQLLKSGLGLCLQSDEIFGNDQKKYLRG